MRVVVKWGGSLDSPDPLARDVAGIPPGTEVFLCHGGSRDIAAVTAQLGVATERLVSPDGTETRRTTPEVLDALQLALRGRTQRRLVEALAAAGVRALGMQGNDALTVTTRWKSPVRAVVGGRTVVVRDNYGGRVEHVDPSALTLLSGAGIVPVICPPGMTRDGVVTNVDADRLAAHVAAALGADVLCLLTDRPGLLRDPGDEDTLVEHLTPGEAREVRRTVAGGMRLKLVAATEAIERGVGRVVLGDGRTRTPLSDCLAGAGTTITEELS